MKRNGISILALALCLLCLALTSLVWLNSDQALARQETRLTQLEKKVEALESQLENLKTVSHLELKDYTLTARAWADGSGADVTVTAIPEQYDENLEVVFFAEWGTGTGASAAESLCQWDGMAYTATISLSAANGYCYYLTAGDENWITLASPDGVTAMEYVYLEESLTSYLTFDLEGWNAVDGILTIAQGYGLAQLPLFDQAGEPVSVLSGEFLLRLEETVLGTAPAHPTAGEADGSLVINAQNLTFDLPELAEGQQAELWLELTLSNGESLTVFCGGWTLTDGELGQVAG